MCNALLLLVFLAAFVFLVKYALQLANEAKEAPTQRRARIVVLVVAIVVLAAWLFGPWPFSITRIRW